MAGQKKSFRSGTIAKMIIYAKGKWKQKIQIKLMHLSVACAAIEAQVSVTYTVK